MTGPNAADQPPNQPPSQPRPLAARVRLSPVQEAYGAYTRHQLDCSICRNVDAGPCPRAALLRQRWNQLSASAIRRVAE